MAFKNATLRVENLEKINRFYQDTFSLRGRRRVFQDHAFTIVYLGLEGMTWVGIDLTSDHGPYERLAHIALSTPDLEALHQNIAFYEVQTPRAYQVTANYYFVRIPDGYKGRGIIKESNRSQGKCSFSWL